MGDIWASPKDTLDPASIDNSTGIHRDLNLPDIKVEATRRAQRPVVQ